MEIKFVERRNKASAAIAIILDEKLELSSQANEIKKETGVDLKQLIKVHNYKATPNEFLLIPTGNDKIKNIILFGVGDLKKAKLPDLIKAGASLYRKLTSHSIKEAEAYSSIATPSLLNLLLGTLLGSYRFDKYKAVKKDDKKKVRLEKLNVISERSTKLNAELNGYKNFSESVALVKDLVAEPSNVKNPITLSKICTGLSKYGLKVEVLDEAKLKSLKMNALLGVGQGSTAPSRVVVIHWNGAKTSKKKIALIGKGVTFDSGGLSLKPAGSMVTMKGDMAGAATVIGMLRMLALRKAKVNVVGVVGLVENMPDGGAQRPGDIVKSMSGQTIEILNTDAEGRLVLADILWYAQSVYKPTVMVDIATLTGAVRICLGDEFAGLLSNNDSISEQLIKAGEDTNERVWRLPLDKKYDKMIDSNIADMQNIGTPDGSAGTSIAAQFLQRFVNKVPWAHLDIGVVSENKKSPDTGLAGPTAFGMRLLNKFIEDNYES